MNTTLRVGIPDNEIYFLINYIKSVLWRVAKCLSYIDEARCLKVNCNLEYKKVVLREAFGGKMKLTGGGRKLQRALGE